MVLSSLARGAVQLVKYSPHSCDFMLIPFLDVSAAQRGAAQGPRQANDENRLPQRRRQGVCEGLPTGLLGLMSV